MNPGFSPCSRRAALRRLALSSLVLGETSLHAAEKKEEELTFFVTADPQIHLDKWGTSGTEETIAILNRLPGEEFPLGGKVAEPKAVLVLGDLVDVVDDPRHWECYKRFFDPNGKALLRYRTFEIIGNHDLSAKSAKGGLSVVQEEFIKRNKLRLGDEFHFDKSNYHYSWDWGSLHFINLNLFPGNEPRPVYDNPAPWNDPRNSLDFLREDLATRIGKSGRPVILLWHYGLRGWGLEKWWTPEDLNNLKAVIAPYNIVLILHGHEHSYAHYEWEGYPVFMCPSPQRDRNPKTPEVPSTPKGFLVIRLKGKELQVAHHEARKWGQVWKREISLGS
jgi:hypothetical protein